MGEEEKKYKKSQRGGLMGRITYFDNLLRDRKDFEKDELIVSIESIDKSYSKFEDVQQELICLGESEDEINAYNDKFFKAYLSVKFQMTKLLNSIKSSTDTDSKVATVASPNATFAVKLPEIELPKFDGQHTNWLGFRDRFSDLVHNDKSILDSIKFHYLLSCVSSGRAYQFVKHLPITSENYEQAWKILIENYDNEVFIQKTHIKDLYDIKKPQEDSYASLQKFIDDIRQHMSALSSFSSIDTKNWDYLLIHHLTEKLDSKSRIEIITESTDKHLTLDEFLSILKKRVVKLRAIKPDLPHNNSSKSTSNSKKDVKKVYVANSSSACPYCQSSDHVLTKCPTFTHSSVTPKARYKFIKQLRVCRVCLADSHSSSSCKIPPCSICSKPHHELLHFANASLPSNVSANCVKSQTMTHAPNTSQHNPNSSTQISDVPLVVSSSTNEPNYPSQILLATALVLIKSSSGQSFYGRALLDSGSQSNFITERFCRMLQLPKKSVSIPVTGITRDSIVIRHAVDVNVESRTSDFTLNMTCLVLPLITGNIPNQSFDFDIESFPSVTFADPTFFKPDDVDLLIGAQYYHDIVQNKSSVIVRGLPPFYETPFGLVVIGKMSCDNNESDSHNYVAHHSLHCSLTDLDDQVKRFWELEQIQMPNHYSVDEKLCEGNYSQNVIRDSTGRYSVALPTKSNIVDLGDSSNRALRQFKAMERKLSGNDQLRTEYVKFMQEYLELNHMEEVNDVDTVSSHCNKDYFLPHHAVFKESSTTTKVRVVFNASASSTSSLSLNDCLMIGPTIQQDLFSIVVRFRKHLVGFAGDITKMYRQIDVHPEYRDLQRIWWRDHPEKPLKCYRLRTVTYGTACAPYLAIRTLKQLATDECQTYPDSSKILSRDFYVDDVLTGASTEQEALQMKTDLIELLSKGGFELRKFQSNSRLVSDEFDSKENVDKPIVVLGLTWNTERDTLEVKIPNYDVLKPCTKRVVLSEIAQLYDPLGLVAPMILTAKLFMQSIWSKSNLQWDDKLPTEMAEFWQIFKSQIIKLQNISVPRCVVSKVDIRSIELHGFADASDKGYGCCIYVRVINSDGEICVNLLCAKSRVSPLKSQTIPRLELCAAVLLAQLMERTINVMEIPFNAVYYWSDSEITLLRIKSSPSKFAVFVANRISLIQELSNQNSWHYVPTDCNPADIVSRGLMPSEMADNQLWFKGPRFLYEEMINWPNNPHNEINAEFLELRKNEVLHVNVESSWDIFSRYSDYNKLLRITSLCRRFIHNCRLKNTPEKRVYDELTAVELHDSLKSLVKNIQQFEFKDDINHLQKFQCVSRKSKLLRLCPFVDSDNILRVGGRLNNSDVPYDHQHPMLLPKSHPFCKLLARDVHKENLHAGVQSLMCFLRHRFWIIGCKNLCKEVVRECVLCFRYKAQTVKQVMGHLPEFRVNEPTRPFEVTGMDFCGPFTIVHQLKKKVTTKVYVCLFICFAVKAIHLEIVSDLTTQGFIMALRRFASRRGPPTHIFSDNATNFVGAKTELMELRKLFFSDMNQNEAKNFCTSKGIQWHTIPPRSPHFGGIWEAGIKSAKFHLKRVLDNCNFTYEYLDTICTQTEAILNSRPLIPLSDDPNDLTCLTPGHFLIGTSLTALPDPSLKHLNFNKLANYQKVQYLLQQFWTRWSNEYLSYLQERTKWQTPNENLNVGSMVLIKEDNTPPMYWKLGRVIEVHCGADGFVRVATVKTEKSVFKRAVAKLCLLPISDNFPDLNNEIVQLIEK